VATTKGSYCLGKSFGVPSICFRLVPSNHTLSLTLNDANLRFPPSCHSCDFIRASIATDRDALMLLRCSWVEGIVLRRVGWCARGVYPISVLKGTSFMVLLGHEFLTYCASGRRLTHSCCWVSQYKQRYVSSN